MCQVVKITYTCSQYRLYLENPYHTEKPLNKGLNELFMFSDFIEPINFHFLQCYDTMKGLFLDNLYVHIYGSVL